MTKILFIGLGTMGYPMAGHLKSQGHDIQVYNRTVEKSEKWSREFNGRFITDLILHDKNYDIIWSNHRCHGHFISYSGMIIELMAEILGKKEGICSGRGGSQHIHYKNFYSNGLLGGSLPQSVGTAFANKDKNKSITCITW